MKIFKQNIQNIASKISLGLGLITAGLSNAFAGTVAAHHHGGGLQMIILMLVFIGAIYLFMIRPNMKRQKEHRNLLSNIDKGDEVSTAGGFFGKVISVGDSTIELEIAKDTVVKLQKQSIAKVLPKGSIKGS